MNPRGAYQIRRATTDDLPQLIVLWNAAQFPAPDLEKRFTEFQIAADSQGRLLAAIGLQIDAADGKVHSETFADFALSDDLRPLLWERLQTVAANHGLFRLWTEESAPFWRKAAGFSLAPADALSRLPALFGPAHERWLALRLKDESADPNLLDEQFRLFKETERARREKLLRRAQALKTIGTGIAALLFIFAMSMLLWLVRRHR
ncbi:MAG: hypothetical protein ABSG59_06905 [Verrucomicrobiota bacterium]